MAGLGDQDAGGVDAGGVEPAAVLGLEVAADCADQQGAMPELGECERDVGAAPTAADVEVLDQERQRDLVELVGHERVGELAREGHEVIGGDRSGDGEVHLHTIDNGLPLCRRAVVVVTLSGLAVRV